jgi:hypothetical protein
MEDLMKKSITKLTLAVLIAVTAAPAHAELSLTQRRVVGGLILAGFATGAAGYVYYRWVTSPLVIFRQVNKHLKDKNWNEALACLKKLSRSGKLADQVTRIETANERSSKQASRYLKSSDFHLL